MDDANQGQVNRSAADVYEEFFVPALFEEWARPVADAAGIEAGSRVLDVACGTGVLARHVLGRVGSEGAVVGLDRNDAMLDVARRTVPAIEWQQGLAESLPFPDSSFDAVVSQFGLMFFEDRIAALSEMNRVVRPGGKFAVAVWDRLESVPGYAAMTALLQRLFGDQVLAACEAPFNLGKRADLRGLFTKAGLPNGTIVPLGGRVHFPSIDAWVHTDIKGWTLADMIDDQQYEQLRAAALIELKRFQNSDGTVSFASSVHIATAEGS